MKRILLAFTLILIYSGTLFSQEVKELKLGDKAPKIKTLDDTGKIWESNKLKGKKFLVVYFYPAAMTGGCTKQACSYRDFKTEIEETDAEVVGVSGDNVEGLKLFKIANNLNFTLLSDEKGDIARSFGVPIKEGGKITREINGKNYDLVRGSTASRWTFIINKKGKNVYKNQQVDASKDAVDVIAFIRKNS